MTTHNPKVVGFESDLRNHFRTDSRAGAARLFLLRERVSRNRFGEL